MPVSSRFIVKHLGSIRVGKGYIGSPHVTSVSVLQESFTDENGYTPAESVEVSGIENVKALRDLCDETIKGYEKDNQPQPPATT